MSFTDALLVLVVAGLVLLVINRLLPIRPYLKSLLSGAVVVAVLVWLLAVIGVLDIFSKIHVAQ